MMCVPEAADSAGKERSKHHRFRLLSAARTVSLTQIARLPEEEARAQFEQIRFAENGGEPYCPRCGCVAVYRYAKRGLFKCKGCERQFSITSGTTFHSRKMSFGDILVAILAFSDAPQGRASLAIADALRCSPKTAYVLTRKLRRAMSDMQADHILTGKVDVDGVYISGHLRQENLLANRKSRTKEYAAKKHCIVTMRERRRGGRSRAFFLKSEEAGAAIAPKVIQQSASVVTDLGDAWHRFAGMFESLKSVNHSVGYSIDGVHINGVECQHLRIRRSLNGVYFSFLKGYGQSYADELSWRDDHREMDNGRRMLLLARRAAKMSVATDLVGYWQKRPVVSVVDVASS